jgi:hypothetical protein
MPKLQWNLLQLSKSHLAILYLFRCDPLLYITYLEGNFEITITLIAFAIKLEKGLKDIYESQSII